MARIIVVLVLLFGVAACGDDPDEDFGSRGVEGDEVQVEEEDEVDLDDPQGADDELISSIEAYARTQIDADPDALLQARSEGCAQVDTDLDTGDVEAGPSADDVSVSEVDADVDGDEATVSYRLDPSGEEVRGERWIREDGEWKWNNC